MGTDMSPTDPERLDGNRRYHDALAALNSAIEALNTEPARAREDVPRLTTALIGCLRQITALLERRQSSATSHQPPATSDAIYLAFEHQFRGSPENIQAAQSEYLPLFAGTTGVVDLGCGRGEFLAALKSVGIAARGVDANAAMVAVARERGLDAVRGDALAFLSSLPDGSVGGLMSAQVVEHLEPPYLMQLLDVARRKLAPGAVVALETINPACWLAFFSSYIRDLTHVRPIHPETLQFLLQAHGFERVSIRYSAPAPEHIKMRMVSVGANLQQSTEPASRALVELMHAVNTNATLLNGLLFSYMDYAVIGFRS